MPKVAADAVEHVRSHLVWAALLIPPTQATPFPSIPAVLRSQKHTSDPLQSVHLNSSRGARWFIAVP